MIWLIRAKQLGLSNKVMMEFTDLVRAKDKEEALSLLSDLGLTEEAEILECRQANVDDMVMYIEMQMGKYNYVEVGAKNA